MKIILILAPVWDHVFPSIGPCYVAAALDRAGHEVSFRDCNIEAWDRFKQEIGAAWQSFESWQPPHYDSFLATVIDPFLESVALDVVKREADAVGFAFMGTNHHVTRLLMRTVRQSAPDIRLFGGGHGMTTELGTELLERAELDAVVLGEGEDAAVDLVLSWQEGADIPSIGGVMQRDAEGRIIFGGCRPPSDLDELPVPQYRDVRFERYEYPGLYDMKAALPILGSRGCTSRCAFCGEYDSWRRYRSRSPENILSELKSQALRYDARQFVFADSLINGHHGSLVRLIDLLNETETGLVWGGQCRLDGRLSADVLGRMARAGCRWLAFGLESGSQRVLDLMRKNVRLEDACRVIRSAHDNGICVHLNVIIGYPGERLLDFLKTLKILFDLRRSIAGVSAFRLRMHRSSPLYRDPSQHGIVLGPDIGDLVSESWRLSDGWHLEDGSNTPRSRSLRYRLLVWLLQVLKVPTMRD